MSRARDMANLGAQAGSGLDASDITSGTLGSSVVVPASVGSSLVLLKSVDTTATSTTTVEFIHGTSGVVFDSTYDTYKIIISNCVPATTNKQFRSDIGTSSSGYSDNTNVGGVILFYNKATNDDNGVTSSDFSASRCLATGGVANDIAKGGVWAELNINKPGDSSVTTTVGIPSFCHADNNGYHYGGCGFSSTMANEANDRIKFYWESGVAFTKGRVSLYGVKYA